MLKSSFDDVMEQRSTQLIEQIGDWLPSSGSVVDIGSGTGHLAARLQRDFPFEVMTTDVADIHVTGRTPMLIDDGVLPFDRDAHSAALLIFMLHYPGNAAALLTEAARVTSGPIVVVQSLYSGLLGYLWLRCREFVWTYVAFHVSRLIGYVPAHSRFSMNARRFYTAQSISQDFEKAGLRVSSRRDRAVLPGGALVVSHWKLERAVRVESGE